MMKEFGDYDVRIRVEGRGVKGFYWRNKTRREQAIIDLFEADLKKIIEKVNDQESDYDAESAHWDADQCMLDFITAMYGLRNIKELWEKIPKWYA